MSELLVKSESLVAVADSIRSKTGSTEELVFPEGFVEAVDGISVSEEIDELVKLVGQDKAAAVVYGYKATSWDNSKGGLKTTTHPATAEHMFTKCRSLTTVPLFDTSNVTDMRNMFNGCCFLTEIPLFDTSNVTSMNGMFDGCHSLTTVPRFDTSNVQIISNMFNYCYSLTTVPLFDTSAVTIAGQTFGYCYSLTTVPTLDVRAATTLSSMFYECRSLTECWLRNIKTNLTVGSGTSYGHLLTVESLLHLIKECRDTGSMKTLTIGTANLEKLANTYVKVIDITDEMRAEDDLIDEKLPFVVCESTDEGAMLITDYVLEKNWQLK